MPHSFGIVILILNGAWRLFHRRVTLPMLSIAAAARCGWGTNEQQVPQAGLMNVPLIP